MANGQIQTDAQQFSPDAATYETGLSAFIGQLVALSWPSSMNRAVTALISTARQFRADLAEEAAVTPSTPTATISAINTQAGTDVGNFDDGISVVNASLVRLGATLPAEQ